MTINLKMPQPEPDLKPRITVIGVGGAGGNAVNNMIDNELGGVDFVVTNTDAQALAQSRCERKIQLGRNITQGLGAGSRPDVGRAAAEEAIEDLIEQIQQCNMVFITAGMGGGTGTGAAPVVARASREQGILTVGVVTKPFQFEGLNRMRIAEEGIEELQHYVDTLIIIPNQNLFRIANEKTTFAEAFEMADNVLYSGVRGVTDLMVMPGLINLDFADVRQVMSEMGKAMMGTGEAEGEGRAIAAAESAISNPLLDDVSMEGARGVLINITGGYDMTLFEVDEAANRIRSEVDPEANIIFGSTFEEGLEGRMRISVISTGIDADAQRDARPYASSHISLVSDNTREAAGLSAGGGNAGLERAPEADQENADDREADEVKDDAPALDLDNLASGAAETADQAEREAAAAEARAKVGNSFLPPPPVEAPESPRESRTGAAARPDPMAEADLLNAGGAAEGNAPSRRRGPSLFERVTGTGRARTRRGDPGAEPRLTAPAPTTTPDPAGTAAPDSTPPEPSPGSPADRGSAVPEADSRPRGPAQQDLGGLEPKDARDKDVEEDLLEIPAFLRRQAN